MECNKVIATTKTKTNQICSNKISNNLSTSLISKCTNKAKDFLKNNNNNKASIKINCNYLTVEMIKIELIIDKNFVNSVLRCFVIIIDIKKLLHVKKPIFAQFLIAKAITIAYMELIYVHRKREKGKIHMKREKAKSAE